MSMFIIVNIIIITLFSLIMCQMCTAPSRFGDDVSDGFELTGVTPIKRLQPKGLVQCMQTCLQYNLCHHINFNQLENCCDLLLNGTVVLTPNNDVISSNKTKWPAERLVGQCYQHDCPASSQCIVSNGQPLCLVRGCSGVPTNVASISETAFTIKPLWNIGEEIALPCMFPLVTLCNVTCQLDGNWTEFECKLSSPPPSCSGRCGHGVDQSQPCQCNTACKQYNDCCQDYDQLCTASTSCVGRCKDPLDSSKPCQCNTACLLYGDCCQDYNAVCLSSPPPSCSGRCGHGVDQSQPCQCNTACKQYNDCCQDYDQLCTADTGGSLTDLMEDLWASDVNRFPESDYVLNYQTKVTDSNRQDKATQRLFTSVNTGRFSSLPTYSTFISILDNYDINVGINDNISPAEWTEINAFLDAILATSVMKKAYSFLHTDGHIPNDMVQWRDYLKELWFNLYPRSSSSQHITDSSGFEHALVGELKSSSVGGFHNWIQFYLEESAGRLDYTGYVSRADPRTVGSQFTWHGKWKGLGSFLVGVSPEFDVAVYSVCAIVHKGKRCSFTLNGTLVQVQSYDIGHKSGNQLATAYVAA